MGAMMFRATWTEYEWTESTSSAMSRQITKKMSGLIIGPYDVARSGYGGNLHFAILMENGTVVSKEASEVKVSLTDEPKYY